MRNDTDESVTNSQSLHHHPAKAAVDLNTRVYHDFDPCKHGIRLSAFCLICDPLDEYDRLEITNLQGNQNV